MSLANISHVAACFGCAGRRGSGKTSRLVRYALESRADFLFAFDPTGQLAQKFRRPPCRGREQIFHFIQTGAVFYQGTGAEDDFDWFCEVVFAACEFMEGRKLFLADEIQTWVNQFTMPPAFRQLVDKGRWHRIDLAFTCQTFNTLHNGLRNQLTEVAAFAHSDSTATKTLLEMGFGATELRDLQRGEYLTRTLDPFGLIHFGDDVKGIFKPLPGQVAPESPLLAKLRARKPRAPR